MRRVAALAVVVVAACGAPTVPPMDAGFDAGVQDAGIDAGVDAGVYEPPVVKASHSLFFNDGGLLDDAALISFPKLMQTAAPGQAGPLLRQWFDAFWTEPLGYERAQPSSFLDGFAAVHGGDPSQWDLSLMNFKMTGVHNRIDRADYGVGGHCGELRASAVSTNPDLSSFHVLFIFRQPAGEGDVAPDGRVTCAATARRWAELSRLEGDALVEAQRQLIREGFVTDRFELIETVEQSISPWQWRQWVKVPSSGPVPFTLHNPPLFQQVDVESLNRDGGQRDEFLGWVADHAAALDARTVEIPQRFRGGAIEVKQGVPRPPLSLSGLRADVAAQYPHLRQNIELVGCAACHTADADFVQTKSDRSISPFYEKELLARERHLEKLARGEQPYAPFGPLQTNPVLPP